MQTLLKNLPILMIKQNNMKILVNVTTFIYFKTMVTDLMSILQVKPSNPEVITVEGIVPVLPR